RQSKASIAALVSPFRLKKSEMDMDRREFQTGLVAALALAMSKMPVFAATPVPDSSIRKTLNRLTFGATASDEKLLGDIGLEAWLDREIAKPADDAALLARLTKAVLPIEYEAGKDDGGKSWSALKEKRAYQYLNSEGERLLGLVRYGPDYGMAYEERIRPAREVQAASLTRAVHADAQLREVMTQFWHDHFSVNSMKDERTGAFFVSHDKVLRAHAFGNFREFLGEVTRSPAMLHYLNNADSRASPANENFARELMELHTLGAENYANSLYDRWSEVPGAKDGLAEAYIDEDVYEGARALTGWTIGDGRDIGENDTVPSTGRFHYVDKFHDPYQKRILGREFPPNQGPMEDGEQLLDLLAFHPGTARYMSRKIARRLFLDEPPEEFVQSVADVFLREKDAPDQIAKVVQFVALSQPFADSRPEKLKRPFEYLASLYRALGADSSSPGFEFQWQLLQAGWSQHEFRPPTGHPDKNEHWANTNYISGLMNIALSAFDDWFQAGKLDLGADLPSGVTKYQDAAAHFAYKMLSPQGADAFAREVAVAVHGNADAQLPDSVDDKNWQLRGIVAMAALHPEFLYR
ncbi:MAG: DUF1800 domain-containing protein, partial [Rhizobiaceae bacterium]